MTDSLASKYGFHGAWQVSGADENQVFAWEVLSANAFRTTRGKALTRQAVSNAPDLQGRVNAWNLRRKTLESFAEYVHQSARAGS